MENLALMSELIETCAAACDNFIKSEMALNDGEVENCQKFSKQGQVLVNALIKDTFEEVKEEFEVDIDDVNDYDYPNNFELIKALNQVTMNAGSLLAEEIDDKVKEIIISKLFNSINTVKEIYLALFEN